MAENRNEISPETLSRRYILNTFVIPTNRETHTDFHLLSIPAIADAIAVSVNNPELNRLNVFAGIALESMSTFLHQFPPDEDAAMLALIGQYISMEVQFPLSFLEKNKAFC